MTQKLTPTEQEILSIGKKVAEELNIIVSDKGILMLAGPLAKGLTTDKEFIREILKNLIQIVAHRPTAKLNDQEQAINQVLVENAKNIMLRRFKENPEPFLARPGETTESFYAWVNNFSADNSVCVLFAKKMLALEVNAQQFNLYKKQIAALNHQYDLLTEKAEKCRGTPLHDQILQERKENLKECERILEKIRMLNYVDDSTDDKDYKIQ